MENIARLVLIILKGVKMDDKGNVYVADTLNLAIIGDSDVTTITGGKSYVAGL